VRAALGAPVVLAQDVAAEVALEVAPHRMDVVAARVVELDQHAGALDAEIVRRAALGRPGPAKAQRLEAALAHAGRIRLRPILMTTFCTLFGLLPLASGLGAGAELQKPLALAVIGGLALSTPVTLLVVPGLYAAIASRR